MYRALETLLTIRFLGEQKDREDDNIETNEILIVLAFCLDDFLESPVRQKCISGSVSLSEWECG